jgi:outer membrane protein assembly factor BamA
MSLRATRAHRLVQRSWTALCGRICLAFGVLACLSALAGPTEAQQGEELPDQRATLADVELACDLPQCEQTEFVERMLSVFGHQAGDIVDRESLSDGYARLLASTFFERCTPSEEWSSAILSLDIDCAGATLIRRVRVRAGTALGSEIRRRVFLRAGQPWRNDQERINRQIAEIVEYFEERGFFGTDVQIRVVEVAPFVVDLTFEIERGQRVTVDQVYVLGNEALEYEEVRRRVLGEFNFLRTFTAERFERAQISLIERYRDMGYIQARIALDSFETDESQSTADLYLEIREGTRWDVRFFGNRLFTREQLLDALSFYQTGFVDEEEIQAAILQLQSKYETVGNVFAEITVTQPPTTDGSRALHFNIREQQPSEIRDIRFDGVTVFEPEFLRGRIETAQYDILASGGYLQRSRLDNDLRTIIELYRQVGYLDAVISRVVLVGENNGRDLHVTVHIDEGQRTALSGLEIVGVTSIEAIDIQQRVQFDRRRRTRERERGVPSLTSVFSPSALISDQSVVLNALQAGGFQDATVELRCSIAQTDDSGFTSAGEPVTCPRARRTAVLSLSTDRGLACERQRRGALLVEECRLVVPSQPVGAVQPRAASQVFVTYAVERGETEQLADWFVRGNFRTGLNVVRRELQLQRGDTFRYGDLLDAQSRLRATRLFDSVRVQTVEQLAQADNDNETHVLVQLEERSSRSIEHRVSLSARIATTEQLLLVLSNSPTIRDINIFGTGAELRLFGSFDFDILQTQRLGDGEFRGTVGAAYIDPRLYLTRRMTDPWEWVVSLTYNYDLLALPPSPLQKELAFRTSVREEFDAIPGLFLGAELAMRSTQTLDQSDAQVVEDAFEPALILSLTPRLTYEGRDNPLNPSRGVFAELEVELADDFVGVLGAARYTRIETRVSGFVPLGRDRFVLALNGRAGIAFGGILQGFQSGTAFALPLSERFRLGGVTSLRGFSDGELTSNDIDSFGGDVMIGGNIELRYPFVRSIDLDGALFLDVGELARDPSDLSLEGFRTSAGFGFRWIIADLIPFLFDYGVVLNRRSGERFGRFHVNIGYTF